MIFKKLLEKFNSVDVSVEELFETAKKISKEFSAEICEQFSEEEVQTALQAILFSVFISQGIPPAVALPLSKTSVEIIANEAKKVSETFTS